MLRIILLVFIGLIFSCKNGFHAPDNKEIQKAVISMYEKRNEADGAGGWKIKETEVLKSWPGNDKRHYNAQVLVKGIHTSPPLAVPRPDEPINETIEVTLIWRGGEWIMSSE